jgi:hypothetical protein
MFRSETTTYITDDHIRKIVREELAKQTVDFPTDRPTTTLQDELRELVGKHECLSRELEWIDTNGTDDLQWIWTIKNYEQEEEEAALSTSAALTVVRGIGKAMCDERGYGWAVHRCHRNRNKWVCWANGVRTMHPTELAAIDALLTAMKERE